MKGILVDFLPDTLSNLQQLSRVSNISRSELIRRGTETALTLFGLPKRELTELLLNSLATNQAVLTSKHADNQKIVKELSRSTSLSAALCAISLVNNGVESSEIIRIYSNSLRRNRDIAAQSDSVLDESQLRMIVDDVVAFANVVEKLQTIEIGFTKAHNSSTEQREAEPKFLLNHNRNSKKLSGR